jgi:hypothetical protein
MGADTGFATSARSALRMRRHAACWSLALLVASASCLAGEPETLVLASKDLGFPEIDTTITFARTGEHTYRVRYSTPAPSPDHLMFYTGFYFCAARRLALDAGFDRFALLPDADVAQRDPVAGGVTGFLKPGEDAAKVLEPRFASAQFLSIELIAKGCPTAPGAAKQ